MKCKYTYKTTVYFVQTTIQRENTKFLRGSGADSENFQNKTLVMADREVIKFESHILSYSFYLIVYK